MSYMVKWDENRSFVSFYAGYNILGRRDWQHLFLPEREYMTLSDMPLNGLINMNLTLNGVSLYEVNIKINLIYLLLNILSIRRQLHSKGDILINSSLRESKLFC